MPNWCNNTIEIQGPSEYIDGFEQFLNENNGKDWFDFFLPCPQELKDVGNVSLNTTNEQLIEKYGYSDWYSWSVDNWGVKWNCDAQDWHRDDPNSIRFWFDSPWGPPTSLYEKISNGDFGDDLHVFAHYHEEGMAFVGYFDDGIDESYEYSDLDSLDSIPEYILDEWNIREMLEERAEWEDEEEIDEEIENGKSS